MVFFSQFSVGFLNWPSPIKMLIIPGLGDELAYETQVQECNTSQEWTNVKLFLAIFLQLSNLIYSTLKVNPDQHAYLLKKNSLCGLLYTAIGSA